MIIYSNIYKKGYFSGDINNIDTIPIRCKNLKTLKDKFEEIKNNNTGHNFDFMVLLSIYLVFIINILIILIF